MLPKLPRLPVCEKWEGTLIDYKAPYLSEALRQNINNLKMGRGTLIYTFCGTKITLTLYASAKVSAGKLQRIFEVLNFVIYYCSLLQGFGYLSKLNVCLVLSPYKKRNTDNTISIHNVNSGMTTVYNGLRAAEIIIYRYEEIIKVLLHEMIHAYDLDTKGGNLEVAEKNLMAHFGVKTPLHVNEAFTDTYASLLNVGLAAVQLHEQTGYAMEKSFGYLWKLETQHMARVAKRALKLQGIEIVKNQVKAVRVPVEESTHVISYYYLKYVGFLNMDSFINLLEIKGYRLDKVETYARFLHELLRYSDVKSKTKRKSYYGDKKLINTKIVKECRQLAADVNNLRMTCVDILNI